VRHIGWRRGGPLGARLDDPGRRCSCALTVELNEQELCYA
jgi:hypothetical protein